jgi:Anti-sigma-K factor rskA/Putative zinc-finger
MGLARGVSPGWSEFDVSSRGAATRRGFSPRTTILKTHEQFADDLALYALHELDGAELQELEQHLETCASCRRELQALRSDLGLLGLSSGGPQPPARSKERLMRAIAEEPRGVSLPSTAPADGLEGGFWWGWIPTLAALALVLVAVGLWHSNGRLKDQVAELGGRNQDQTTQLDRLNQEMTLLTSPDAVHVSLNPQKAIKQPSGTAIFSPTQKRMMFMASNLAPVPEGKAYELWIIPAKGAPIGAGVFKPDEHGNAVMMDHPMPEGVEAKAFAITLEKEEGSDQPTSPILLMGAGE